MDGLPDLSIRPLPKEALELILRQIRVVRASRKRADGLGATRAQVLPDTVARYHLFERPATERAHRFVLAL